VSAAVGLAGYSALAGRICRCALVGLPSPSGCQRAVELHILYNISLHKQGEIRYIFRFILARSDAQPVAYPALAAYNLSRSGRLGHSAAGEIVRVTRSGWARGSWANRRLQALALRWRMWYNSFVGTRPAAAIDNRGERISEFQRTGDMQNFPHINNRRGSLSVRPADGSNGRSGMSPDAAVFMYSHIDRGPTTGAARVGDEQIAPEPNPAFRANVCLANPRGVPRQSGAMSRTGLRTHDSRTQVGLRAKGSSAYPLDCPSRNPGLCRWRSEKAGASSANPYRRKKSFACIVFRSAFASSRGTRAHFASQVS